METAQGAVLRLTTSDCKRRGAACEDSEFLIPHYALKRRC